MTKVRREVYRTGQIARVCRVATRTVMKWVKDGHLKGYTVPGSRERRVTRAALEKFITANGMPAEWLADLDTLTEGSDATGEKADAGVGGGDGVGAGDRGADKGAAGDLRGGRVGD